MPALGNLNLLVAPDPHKPSIRADWSEVARMSWTPRDAEDYAARFTVTGFTDADTVGEVRARVAGTSLTTQPVVISGGTALDKLSGFVQLGVGDKVLIIEGRITSGAGKMWVTNVGNGVALTSLAQLDTTPAGSMEAVFGGMVGEMVGTFTIPDSLGAPGAVIGLTGSPADGAALFSFTAPTTGGAPTGYLFNWEIVGAPSEQFFHVNVGGPEITVGGITWDADDESLWAGGTPHTYATPNDIANTSDDVLYITQRWGPTMTRFFDVPDGEYVVSLFMAEQTPSYISGGVGTRVWSATANGVSWDDVDVWDLVEGYRAVRLERNVTATEGQGIYVEFAASVQEAFVNAIAIRSGSDAAADPTPMTHTTPPPPAETTVKGDSNLPGADADKLSTPGVLAMFNFNNGDTSRWGVQTSNNASNLLMPTSDASFTGNDGRFGRFTNPGNLTYPEARWGGSIYPRLENIGIAGQNDLYYRYYIYFPSDYHWTHGKLPGIGGKVGSGGISEGGNFDLSSFSAKLLFQPDKGLSNYMYVWRRGSETINTKSNPGRGWATRFVKANGSVSNVFTNNTWHKVVVRIRMNSAPGVADGIVQVWVDDHMGIDSRNYEYRTSQYPGMTANFVLFTWFFGGPESDMPNYNSSGTKVADKFVDIGFDRMVVGTSYAAVS